MKKFPLIIALVFTAVCARGASVGWNAVIDTGLVDNVGAGTAVPTGNWIRLGFFSGLTDLQVQVFATAGNQTALNNAFKDFATATVGTGTSTPGIFSVSSTPSYSTLDVGMPNHQMYLWALLAAPANNTNATTASLNATAQAIFYEPSGSNSSWAFPALDTSPTKTIDISQAKISLGGVYLAGSYQSSNASISGILGAGAGAVQLQTVTAVPEPSTLTFGALAALAAAGARRRRRD